MWATEHGPRGGDELNRLSAGRNYGWPLVTYGTEDGTVVWPLAEDRRDHGRYEEPDFVWVPSVGISNLIELGPRQFPAWRGDLLVGSLGGASLFRIRLKDNRVVYAEPIRIGLRVRDLTEDTEGRILLWTDEGEILSLVNAASSTLAGVHAHDVKRPALRVGPGQESTVR